MGNLEFKGRREGLEERAENKAYNVGECFGTKK